MPSATNRIVIVGAGAAGVFTAYRLREMYGDTYEIVLLEASSRVGGNCFSATVEQGGTTYNIDCGAQFFFKNPQASYVALLEQLGLMDSAEEVISAPAGFTIWDKDAAERRLWIPSRVPGFLSYSASDWDRLIEFGTYLAYSLALDREPPDWTLSVDAWLAKTTLLTDYFKENVVKPFMYQFVSLPLARVGEASARYAVTYFARNVFGEPRVEEPDADPPSLPALPTFKTYQSMIGLDGIHKLVLAAVDVSATLNSPVTSLTRVNGVNVVQTAGGPIEADHVVFACDPHKAAAILQAGGTSPAALIDILKGMEYAPLPISMQQGASCWMPADTDYWEPVTTIVDGSDVSFSAWFGPLRPKDNAGNQLQVFKSWGAPDVSGCPHEFLAHQHYIPMPTTTFMALRESLSTYQGQDGVWFAGGWTNWFDSQEAALDSATTVADRLPGVPLPATGKARMIAPDHRYAERNLRRWLERAARHAPEDKRDAIANAIEEVATRG